MKVIIELVKTIIEGIGKLSFTFYLLLKCKFTGKAKIRFPLNLRGHGKNKFGNNLTISRGFFLNNTGELNTGANTFLGSNAILVIKEGSSLTIGDNCSINSNCRITINESNWVWGNDISVSPNCLIFPREKGYKGTLRIGSTVSISDNVIIDMCDDVTIGNGVALGNNVTIFTHNHIYTDKSLPAWKGGIKLGKVTIEDGAWIGANVVIMPGVTIGARSVIGSGAVVTKNTTPETIYAGVPAKEIKTID